MKTIILALTITFLTFTSCQKIERELPNNPYATGEIIDIVEIISVDYTSPELFATINIKVNLDVLPPIQRNRITGLYFRHERGQFTKFGLDQTTFSFSPSLGENCVRFGGIVEENGVEQETFSGQVFCLDL